MIDNVHMYFHNPTLIITEEAPMATKSPKAARMPEQDLTIERVQTGVKIEKRLLKVLKALAEYHDMSLGDLLEGIVLHAFDGKAPFEKASLARIQQLKKIYGLDLDASHSHRLQEAGQA